MDWGLFDPNDKHPYLRAKLVYPRGFYYFAIINNLVCRLLWTVSLSVGWFQLWFPDGLLVFLALAEIYRLHFIVLLLLILMFAMLYIGGLCGIYSA